MKEIREIIKAYDAATKTGKKTAIASIVHLNGSSYRRPGARMLVTDDGELTGAISGGCLEGDALRKAMLVLAQQKSKLVTYDTNDEDEAGIGVQLGCAGIIDVLFEPVNEADPQNPIRLLRQAISRRQKSVLVTLFSLEDKRNEHPGSCLLLKQDGTVTGDVPYPALKEIILRDVHHAMQAQLSFFKNYLLNDISITAFIEYLQPPVSLVIVGAGNDAIPMMQIAGILGWNITVTDGRNTHAKPERFTAACSVVVTKPESALEQIAVDEYTVFVLMTHNYNYDKAMLRALLTTNARYVGLLGPKKKLQMMLDELQNEGVEITGEKMKMIYGPVGLEIGAETAEEIAVSVIAEIQAVLSGKEGTSLRKKTDAIHSTSNTE